MNRQNRREAVRAFKERKARAGVFAVRCAPTGEVWVSASRNLDGQRTSLWFQLKMKGCYTKSLQAAWNAHGEAAFAFEVLQEVQDEDLTPAGLADELKRLDADWRARLGAQKALG